MPDGDLASFPGDRWHFANCAEAATWAQEYAMQNGESMVNLVLAALWAGTCRSLM